MGTPPRSSSSTRAAPTQPSPTTASEASERRHESRARKEQARILAVSTTSDVPGGLRYPFLHRGHRSDPRDVSVLAVPAKMQSRYLVLWGEVFSSAFCEQ